ncbi:MAG: hypothetical protein ACXWB2_05220, partial [Acidimicrobiales bacterium]
MTPEPNPSDPPADDTAPSGTDASDRRGAATSKVLVGITLEDAFRAQELLLSANRLASKGQLKL